MPEAQLKGSAYHSTFAFIEARFGEDAKARVIARLSPEERRAHRLVDDSRGWLIGLLTLSGVFCRAKGAETCAYEIDWT